MLTQEQIHELAAFIAVNLAKDSPFTVHNIPSIEIAKFVEGSIHNYFITKDKITPKAPERDIVNDLLSLTYEEWYKIYGKELPKSGIPPVKAWELLVLLVKHKVKNATSRIS